MRDLIPVVAARAALLLSDWIGMSPLAKSNNGDRSPAGGIGMMLGALVAAEAPPPPTDAAARMEAHIAQKMADSLARWHEGVYLSFDVDYGPDRKLSELADACGIRSSWPIKSGLTISVYPTGTSITDRRGYGAEGLRHHLVAGRGWLVSPCSIDQRLAPVVLAAVERGEVDASVARFEPFAAAEVAA